MDVYLLKAQRIVNWNAWKFSAANEPTKTIYQFILANIKVK